MAMSNMLDLGCKPPAADLASSSAESDWAVAPPWHTAVLVTVIIAVAVTGTALGGSSDHASGAGNRWAGYGALLAVQWGLLFYVCRVGRRRSALPALVGRRWNDARRALGDVALAVALSCVIVAMNWGLRGDTGGSTSHLLPATSLELTAWVVVASSVGFCEEVVYRGYLQTQLAAFTRNAWAGVAIQALLFGVAHADQGPGAASRITAYGALFGLVAARRRSLIPGIIAHAGIDLAAAFR